MTIPNIHSDDTIYFKNNLKVVTYILTLQWLKVNHVEPSGLRLGLVTNLHAVL